jgi:hypothetical protein
VRKGASPQRAVTDEQQRRQSKDPPLWFSVPGFFSCFFNGNLSLIAAAGIYEMASRMGFLKRFPYRVIYFFEQDQVEVIGVVHVRRAPRSWQQRV